MSTRRENDFLQEADSTDLDIVAAVAATTTFALGKLGRDVRIDAVDLIVPSNYAADPANYYVFTIQDGATVLASWSTLTGAQGALTANVPAEMVMSSPANAAKGDVLTLVCTKHASGANVPAQTRVRVKMTLL